MKHKQTVLIVDDNTDNLNVAAQTLIQNDINVILAQSGEKALKSVDKFMPNLILLDIMMPGMDGFEVCKILKSNKKTKYIPIIFLSAINETKNIVQGFELGAVDYINKPFISKVLISRVDTHLKIYSQLLELQNKEKLVLESEAKLRSVINSIPDLIFYKDTENKYTGVNKAYARHLKQHPKSIIGKTDFDFFNNKEAGIFEEFNKKVILTREDFAYEEWTKNFSGKNVYLDTRITPLLNSEGNTTGIVGVSRDISDLKIIEKTLKENEEKLQTIYDNANEGIFVLQNNKVVFLNQKLCDISAYTKEEIQERSFMDFIHKKDKKKVLDLYQKKLAGEKIGESIIFRINNKTGELKYVKINANQINWEGQAAILALLDDITEQYSLEIKLKESEDRYRSIIESTIDVIFVADMAGNILFVNERQEQVFGRKSEDIIGRHFSEFVPIREIPRYLFQVKNIISKKVITNFETNIFDKNNNPVPVELNGRIVKRKDRNIILASIRDITKRKNAEKELEIKNKEIKQKNEDILASIRYAKTIQTSLLPEKNKIDKILKNNFIIFKPKDIVSGDFYYVNQIENNIYFSVADCTGHGVPGGFITMLGIKSIHGILREGTAKNPADILNCLRRRIKEIFKGTEKNNINGIDIAFCSVNLKTNILQYSGAYNPLWILRDNELIEIKANRNPIGFYPVEKDFTNHTFQLKNKDKIYLFSDGFKDQIRNDGNTKYNNIRFKTLIIKISQIPVYKQKNALIKELESWQGENEQIDDITIMGVEWKM